MWGSWAREHFRVLLLFLLLLLFILLYLVRRLLHIEDSAQTEFLNDCAKITLGAVLGVLSERAANRNGNGK